MGVFVDEHGKSAYTSDQVCELFGITRRMLDWYVRHGYLKTYGDRGGRRITAESLHWWRWWQETPWPEHIEPRGHIYLIHSYHLYKIGLSKQLDERLRSIQAMSATPVTLMHTIPTNDTARAEAFLHELYAAKRKHGEWFQLRTRDVETIRNCRALYFRDKWWLE